LVTHHQLCGKPTYRLADWLTGWLASWLAGWLAGWLVYYRQMSNGIFYVDDDEISPVDAIMMMRYHL